VGKTVRVQYFGSIRAAAQSAGEEAVPEEGMTVAQLLRNLAESRGGAFRDAVRAADGGLRDDLTVSLNGEIFPGEAAPVRPVRPGDALALFPVFPGGG
jgi:molybdopterin converting factor small subunit